MEKESKNYKWGRDRGEVECVEEWGRNLMEERKIKTKDGERKEREEKKDLDLSGDMLIC